MLLENGALFLHIPKTGGMWVSSVLHDLRLVRCRVVTKHADMEHVLDCARHHPGRYLEALVKVGPWWQQRVRAAYKFCFVRHPLAWYESYWLFMRARGWNRWGLDRRGRPRWHPNAALDGLGSDDFNQFIRNVLERAPGYVSGMFGAYATAEMSFVGKQERLADDVIAVLKALGVSFDESRLRGHARVNVSNRPMGKPVWDTVLRRDVLAMEKGALERFGYSAADEICRSNAR